MITYSVDGNGCWIWPGAKDPKGYGVIRRNGRTQRAHRFFYEEAKGSVPAGYELDHLCRVRACVNPAHLEVVTHAENLRRASVVRITCKNGHPYPADSQPGRRRCATCKAAHSSAPRRLAYQREWRKTAAERGRRVR